MELLRRWIMYKNKRLLKMNKALKLIHSIVSNDSHPGIIVAGSLLCLHQASS